MAVVGGGAEFGRELRRLLNEAEPRAFENDDLLTHAEERLDCSFVDGRIVIPGSFRWVITERKP